MKLIIRNLEINLNNYEQALSVAKDIDLIETIPTSILSGNSGSVINEPVDLFYKGTKALSSEIKNVKDDFNNLKRTSTYNGLISQIEVANNQIQNLKKTTDYNNILEEREKIIYKLNNLKLSTEYNNFFEIENNIKNRINLLKELKLEWNPILELAINNDSKNYTIIYTPIGLLMGLLLAIVIIIFKNFRYSKIKY